MSRSRKAIFFCTLALALACPASAQEKASKRPITVEDLWKVKRLGKPAISPDGRWVAVEVTQYAMEDNSSQTDLWLLSTDGATQRQLTSAKGKNSGPVWSPEGKRIAFVSSRSGDVSQVFVISPEGGEARQLSKLPMSPAGLKWAPDGKTVYCVVRTWLDTPDDDSYKKREKERKDDKVQAYVIDDAMFRYWDHWIADGKRPVVFAVDAETGKHKNLFAGVKLHLPIAESGAASYDISPDGKEICFTADSTQQIGTDFNLDLYTMSLDRPGQPGNITKDNPASDSSPVYSPNGSYIAFLRQTTKFFYADRARIMVLDRATGKTAELEGRLPPDVTAGTVVLPEVSPRKPAVAELFRDKLDRSSTQVSWSPDNARLFFEAEDKGYHRIGAYAFDSKQFSYWTSGHSDHSMNLSSNGEHLVFLRSQFDFPTRLIWRKTVPHKEEKERDPRLDRFNDDLVRQWDLGAVKEVYYKGADDNDVQMWIVYPPGFDAKKKWPLLMVVHGGPHNGITTDFHYRWNAHLQASKGYVVAIPNFHGSSGFGQKFTDSITGDMATKPFIDVMKATDYMEKQPYIDKDRMAAAGASYGGFMMAWLNGHTDRFKAMICHAGVYNWHSMMASDIVRSRERPLGALPWGDLSKIDKQSPQRFAANFKTPTLVMHGEKDYRVPVTQGLEYYATLRLKGVPTRMVYFPDENHWVMKPQNSRLWHREFFAWLEKHVGTGPTQK